MTEELDQVSLPATSSYDRIPTELRAQPQWVVWRREPRNGKQTKVPYDANSGRKARCNDPATWCSFDEAIRSSSDYDGIGFVFSEADPFCGIDVDGFIDEDLIAQFGSYAERSQSGQGCHIIVRAMLPGNGRKRGRFEIYDRGRFFVMTGDVLAANEVEERQELVDRFIEGHFNGAAGSQLPLRSGAASDAIVHMIRNSDQAAKFDPLWRGEWQGRYASCSEADAALLSILRFWTKGDQAVAFQLFAKSGLCREKWRNRSDYRENTWSAIDSGPVLGDAVNPAISANTTISASGVRLLTDFQYPPEDDPNELLRRRFLCKSGGGLFCGPSGIGKSAAIVQAAIQWSVGKSFFGIDAAQPLKILIVQAENDDGDIAEMRDGVLDGLRNDGELTEEQSEEACRRVCVCKDVEHTSGAFGLALDALITATADVDLVIVDPAFAYLGGDASSARDVSRLLREIVNPLLVKHNVGLIFVHHTNKPLRGREKDEWKAGDFAYLGSGSIEWANWARCVLALRSIGSDRIFELRAAKRGRRLNWIDDNGQRTAVRHAMHSERGIYWRRPTSDEVEEELAAVRQPKKRGRARAPTFQRSTYENIVRDALEKAWTVGDFKKHITEKYQVSQKGVDEIVRRLREDDRISRGRVNRGVQPIHLIGSEDAVREYQLRIREELGQHTQ